MGLAGCEPKMGVPVGSHATQTFRELFDLARNRSREPSEAADRAVENWLRSARRVRLSGAAMRQVLETSSIELRFGRYFIDEVVRVVDAWFGQNGSSEPGRHDVLRVRTGDGSVYELAITPATRIVRVG